MSLSPKAAPKAAGLPMSCCRFDMVKKDCMIASAARVLVYVTSEVQAGQRLALMGMVEQQ